MGKHWLGVAEHMFTSEWGMTAVPTHEHIVSAVILDIVGGSAACGGCCHGLPSVGSAVSQDVKPSVLVHH